MSKQDNLERQLQGKQFTRANNDRSPLQDLIAFGRKAMPSNFRVNAANQYQEIPGLSETPRTGGVLSLQRDLLPALLDDNGLVFKTPGYSQKNETLTLAHTLAENSRVFGAGARLIPFEVDGEALVTNGILAFREEPARFVLINSADFAAQTEEPGTGEATVTPSPLPVDVASIDRSTTTQRAVSFEIPRSYQKERTDAQLSAEIMQSLAIGIGRAADQELFKALTDQAASLNTLTIGNVAQSGVKLAELNSFAGPASTAQFSDLLIMDNGERYLNGIKFELTPDLSGAEVLAGAFDRAAIAITDDINLIVSRTNADGSIEVTAWLDMQALLPNPTRFFFKA